MSANSIASVLLNNGKWKDTSPKAKAHTRRVNTNIKEAIKTKLVTNPLSGRISTEEIVDAILCLRNGKAPGVDHIHPELMKTIGLKAMEWLRSFLSDCMDKTSLPAVWRQAKVTAILKPRKPADDPKSYRPISLLSMTYKLMERIILSRVNDIVELHLPHVQAGFRKGRSTTDQITRLVNDIESSFQRKEKFGLVLIDLSATYDTVWHRGLYLKLLRIIPDIKVIKLVNFMMTGTGTQQKTETQKRPSSGVCAHAHSL